MKKEDEKQIDKKKITEAQMRALHLWFTQLSEAFNDAGFDLRKTLKVDVPWTPALIKELIWRPVMQMFLEKTSTTELNKTEEIDKVFDIINRTIGERYKIHIPFPDINVAMDRERELENQ